MTAGDNSEWEGFLAGGGVSSVLALTLDAWAGLTPPAEDELEERTSIRLYSAMVKKQDRQRHRFLIRYEDVEVETDLAAETGRKDIVFFPGHDGSLYFCLEAKRLNVRVKGVMKSLADEYVKNGMQRFVDGKYSRAVHHAGMLGYVLDGDVARSMANVLANIRIHHVTLGMNPPGDWSECSHRQGDPNAKESEHRRGHTTTRFQLQHLFVAAVPAPAKGRKRAARPARKSDSGKKK